MNKNPLTSKTLWGAGVAGLIILLQTVGITPETTLFEVIKILAGTFGVYGLRDSIK